MTIEQRFSHKFRARIKYFYYNMHPQFTIMHTPTGLKIILDMQCLHLLNAKS